MLWYSHLISFLEDKVQMAFNQQDFHQDKAKLLKILTVCGVRISTRFERAIG